MACKNRWVGKVAVVTGASAGIGACVVQLLVKNGMKVVGMARRVERIEEMRKSLKGAMGELFALKCDVAETDQVEAAFQWVEDKFGTINVLVNNAGVTRVCSIADGNLDYMKETININVIGLTACCQKAMQLMRKSGVDDGHIININSITGHSVFPVVIPLFNVYPASKHAVSALTEVLRQELNYMNTNIKITSISPGMVDTEIAEAARDGSEDTDKGIALAYYQWFKSLPKLQSKDVADAVLYVLQTPPHVQVHELIIKPIGEPF